jgi:hypothetical protein
LQVLDRGAKAVARGGARCASQGCFYLPWLFFASTSSISVPSSLPRRRDAVAAEKNKFADVQRKRVNFNRVQRRIIRARVLMAAANLSPAVVSRRAKYVDDYRLQTHLGAQPRSQNLFFSRRRTIFIILLFKIILSCSRGEGCTQHRAVTRSQYFKFSLKAKIC